MSDFGDDNYGGGGYDDYGGGGYDEGGYAEGGYDDYKYADNQPEQVMGYKQSEQVSYTHQLFNESNQLKPFADGVRSSLSEIYDFGDNEFNQNLNQILTFVDTNHNKIGHMEYKNPNTFVLAYLCIKDFTTNPITINENKLKKYKNININDVIRYCTLIQQMNL